MKILNAILNWMWKVISSIAVVTVGISGLTYFAEKGSYLFDMGMSGIIVWYFCIGCTLLAIVCFVPIQMYSKDVIHIERNVKIEKGNSGEKENGNKD